MPLITIAPYQNKRILTAFDVSQFVKVSQSTVTIHSSGDKFFNWVNANTNTTPIIPAALWRSDDALKGFTKVNTTTLPYYGDWSEVLRNKTTRRLFMVLTYDNNNTDNRFLYSDDEGVTWTTTTLPFYQRWSSLGGFACDNNNTVIVTCNYVSGTTTYAKTVRSQDGGQTWTDITAKFGGNGGASSMYYCERLNMFLAGYSTGVHYSTDGGNTWTQSPSMGSPYFPTHGPRSNFIDTGSLLVFFVRNGTGGLATIRTSTDGINWDSHAYDVGETVQPTAIAYGAGLFVMVHNSYKVYTSTDLVTWSVGQLPTGTGGTSASNVVFANNQFIVTGGNNYLVYQT